jgi:hypothetical protein
LDPESVLATVFQNAFGVPDGFLLKGKSPEMELLWYSVLSYTRKKGFCKLRGIRDSILLGSRPEVIAKDAGIEIPLPKQADALDPVFISADQWGRRNLLQMLCYESGNDEPTVRVRYNEQGKVMEVLASEGVTLLVEGQYKDSEWEKERDANPDCRPGNLLRMPSGQIGEVIRLQDRYDNDFESFVGYSNTYGVWQRLDPYPGAANRKSLYVSLEDAWEANPLTVSTTDPSDFSLVPEETIML